MEITFVYFGLYGSINSVVETGLAFFIKSHRESDRG